MFRWIKEWLRKRRRSKMSELIKTSSGTELVGLVQEVVESFDFADFDRRYHRSVGELIRVEFFCGPVVLLERMEALSTAMAKDGYIPDSFTFNDKQKTNLDDWLTVNGAYLLALPWSVRLKEELATLHSAMRAADVCEVEKRSYYLRRSKMLLQDLGEVSRALLAFEES